MTTLSSNKPRSFELGDENSVPVIAADIIYEGAFVGLNGSGYARPLTAGDAFAGIALEQVDNSAGAAGAKKVRVRRFGDVELSVTGVSALTDKGADVYASDDDTFTLTMGSNTRIGYIKRWVSGTKAIVCFSETDGTMTELTDNSSGAASDAIAVISDTATKNAVASLAAKVNALIRKQGN